MTLLNKYNLQGEKIGSVEVNEGLAKAKAHSQLVKDYIVALRANARQWSASTKGRSEVAHTTKKPHKQKGTGRARQGSLVAPQFRGGGIVFGPKPKFDQHVRVNKKERKAAIRAMIADKISKENVLVLDNCVLDQPKTKVIAQFLKSTGIQKRVLFLCAGAHLAIETGGVTHTIDMKTSQHLNLLRSLRNIPKTEFSLAKNVNGYDLMLAEKLVVTEDALNELTQWLV